MNDLLGMLKKRKLTIETCPIPAEAIATLCVAMNEGHLDRKTVKELIENKLDAETEKGD